MRIFLDNCLGHVTIQRMLPYWKNLGIEVSEKSKNCTHQLSYVRISEKSNLPITLRLDGIYYNSEINYIGKNFRLLGLNKIHPSHQKRIRSKSIRLDLQLQTQKQKWVWSSVHLPLLEIQYKI